MCKTRFGKWWYNRSVRGGILFFGTIMLALSMFKHIIFNDGETVYAFIEGVMLMFLVLSSVVVGALLGIDFKNHEDEKNKTESGK